MTPSDPGSAGELHVAVTGDITNLLAALDEAAKAGTQAGEEIGASFAASTTQMDLFAESVTTAATAMQQLKLFDTDSIEATSAAFGSLDDNFKKIGDDAETAGASVEHVGEGVKHAGEAAQEAGNQFEALAEHALHFLEMVGVTLAFEEIAREALLAVSATQQLEQSLTFFTGSAATAAADIEQLKTAAIGLHVPFEQMFADMQRIGPALGGFQAALPLFEGAANAAHALGLSFDEMVSKLDRMALSGVASARVLASIQLSVKDLDEATKSLNLGDAFKDLTTVADRVSVLDEVMKKFAGDNELYAETLKAKWTDFRNQFGLAMDGIGTALEPIAAALLEFVSTVLQDLVPVFSALASLSSSVVAPALRDLSDAFKGLSEMFGGANLVAIVAATTAIFGFGTAVQGAGVAVAGFELGTWLYNNSSAFKAFGDSIADSIGWLKSFLLQNEEDIRILAALGDAEAKAKLAIIEEGAAVSQLVAKLAERGIVIAQGTKSLDEYARALSAAAASYGGVTAAVDKHSAALQKIIDQQTKLEEQAATAKKALDEAATDLAKGTISQLDYNRALAEYDKALAAVNAKLPKTKEVFKDVSDELIRDGEAVEKAITGLPGVLEAAGEKIDKAITFDKFEKGLIDLNQVVDTETKAATKNLDALILSMKNSAAGQTEEGQNLIKILEDQRAAVAHFVADRAFEDLGKQIDDYTAKSEADAERLQTINIGLLESFKTFGALGRDTGAVFQNIFDPAVQASVKLNEALKRLKVDGVEGLSVAASHAVADFNVVLDGFDRGVISADTLESSYQKVFIALGKLGTSTAIKDLADATDRYVQDLIKANAPWGVILAAQEAALKKEIDIAAARGLSDNVLLDMSIHLEKIKMDQMILRDQTMGLSDLFTGMVHALGTAWDGLEKGIADSIVAGQGFGKAMEAVLTQLETKITELAVKFFLDELRDSILKNTDALGEFGKLFHSLFGSAATPGAPGQAPKPAEPNQVGGALAQTASSLMNVINLIANIVQAISDIVIAFEIARTNTLLGEIEVTSRQIFNTLSGSAGISASSYLAAQLLQDIDNWNQGVAQSLLVSISSDLDGIAGTLVKLLDVVVAGGLGANSEMKSSASFSSHAAAFAESIQATSEAVTTFAPAIDDYSTAIQKAAEGTAQYNAAIADAASNISQMTMMSGAAAQVAAASAGVALSTIPRQAGAMSVPTPFLPSLPSFATPSVGASNSSTLGQTQSPYINLTITGNAITSQDSAQKLAATMVAALRNNAGLKL